MIFRVAALSALLLVAASGAAVPRMVPHQSLSGFPQGWKDTGRADANQLLHFSVAVTQNPAGVAELETRLFAAADPTSPAYGQHMTREEVDAMVAPSTDSVAAVTAWLTANGATELSSTPNSDFISATLPVSTVEKMLDAEYHVFAHPSGSKVTRVEKYSLPSDLVAHIDLVSPTIRFPHINQMKLTPATAANLGVDPTSLRSLMKIGDATGGAAPNNLQAALGFLNQFTKPSDLQEFFSKFAPSLKGQTYKVIGPNEETHPGIEASLDVEYIMSIGSNISTVFWSVAGQQPHNPENEPFLKWLEDVFSSGNPIPKTQSVSYGDNEVGVDYAYAVRVNSEFKKLGAQGVSILFASGDGGVSGGQPSECTKFVPTWPAGSIYVTAVGGTDGQGTSAASLSAGGFADYFGQPSYQTAAVNHYFSVASNLPSADRYNKSGAGIPDVAAPAEGFAIVYDGFETGVAGTSCAAPTFAGFISLLNDMRLAAGKSTLGYLNPLIYSKGSALFTDITTGSNPGCGTEGFQAAEGWDPVTGFGIGDFTKWSDAVMALP